MPRHRDFPKDHLRHTLAITQVDEDDAVMVAVRIHPSGEGHGLADVGRAKLIAVVGAIHGAIFGSAECSGKLRCGERKVRARPNTQKKFGAADRLADDPDVPPRTLDKTDEPGFC
jgi:hypothetical protein